MKMKITILAFFLSILGIVNVNAQGYYRHSRAISHVRTVHHYPNYYRHSRVVYAHPVRRHYYRPYYNRRVVYVRPQRHYYRPLHRRSGIHASVYIR